jgi:hypothetical protein
VVVGGRNENLIGTLAHFHPPGAGRVLTSFVSQRMSTLTGHGVNDGTYQ